MYGSIENLKIYKYIWILIINQLEEAYWCKLKLNSTFIKLLQSQHKKDTVLNLTINGHLESLENNYISFPHLCQSNLGALQRYLHNNKHDLSLGLYYACTFGKLTIAEYLIDQGATDISSAITQAIIRGHTNCVVSILKKHSLKLKLCFDNHHLAIINYYRGPILNFDILSKISSLVEFCPCKIPQNHMFPTGAVGVQGPVGACGIGASFRGSDERVDDSRYKKKLKRQTYTKIHSKYK